MAAALRSLQKLGSLSVAAAAATTLSYNKPSACDQRRRFEGKTIVTVSYTHLTLPTKA